MGKGNVLSNNRYDEIKKEVCLLLGEFPGLNYPINPFELAKQLFYIIIPYSSLNSAQHDAAVNISDDAFSRVEIDTNTGMNRYVIYYNDLCCTESRIQWSLAHEIGHIYLGHHDIAQNENTETEANFFAKYLLAPPPIVHSFGCHSPKDIASVFHLSAQASQYAYDYYKTWLRFGPPTLQDFENELIANHMNKDLISDFHCNVVV